MAGQTAHQPLTTLKLAVRGTSRLSTHSHTAVQSKPRPSIYDCH